MKIEKSVPTDRYQMVKMEIINADKYAQLWLVHIVTHFYHVESTSLATTGATKSISVDKQE